MSKERENKAVVERWFREFWGNPWNPRVVDELGTPDLLVHYPMHGPRRGRDEVKKFMSEFREAFPDLDFWGVGGMIAEGDYVVGAVGWRRYAYRPRIQRFAGRLPSCQ